MTNRNTIYIILALLLCLAPSANASLSTEPDPVQGKSIHFDGVDDKIVISNDGSFDTGSLGMTVDFWLKADEYNYNGAILALRDDNGSRFSLHLNPTTGLIGLWNSQEFTTIAETGIDTEWHHLAFVFTGSNAELYVDGELASGVLRGINPWVTEAPLVIGGPTPTANYEMFKGQMDNLRLWDRAMPASFIKDIAMMGQVSSETLGLIASYDFNNDDAVSGSDNSSQTTLTDISGNGHDGTLADFALNGSTSNWVSQSESIPTEFLDTSLPYIFAPNEFYFQENAVGTIYDFNPFYDGKIEGVTPNTSTLITYDVRGDDGGFFNIDYRYGILTFKNYPNYEVPADKNGDNVYEIEIRATGGGNRTKVFNVSITVTDQIDNIAPEITSVELTGSRQIDISFTEGIYSGNLGTGALAPDDFTIEVENETPIDANIESITKLDGGVLFGDETQIRLTLSFSQLLDGSETIKLTPAINSIFDREGNELIIDQDPYELEPLEQIVPTLISFDIEGTQEKDAQEVTYRAVFSEPVREISVEDFQVDLISGFAEAIITRVVKDEENDNEYLISATILGSIYNEGDQTLKMMLSDDNNIVDLVGNPLETFDNSNNPSFITSLTNETTTGELNMVLEPDDIPSSFPIALNTTSIGLFIPQISTEYPDAPVKVNLHIDSFNPNETWYTGNENLYNISPFYIDIYVQPEEGDDFIKVIKISGDVTITGSDMWTEKNSDTLRYSLSSIQFDNLKESDNTLGTVNLFLLKFKLNLASLGIVAGLNTRWQNLKYPTVPIMINEIKLKDDDSGNVEFIEFYDGGIGHIHLKKFESFDANIDIETNDEGFFVMGTSQTPNVDNTFFDTFDFKLSTKLKNFYGEGNRPDIGGIGTTHDFETFTVSYADFVSSELSFQRIPQNIVTRGDSSQFTNSLPSPGKANTIFASVDSLSVNEGFSGNIIDILAYSGNPDNYEEGLTYSLNGVDADAFNIDPTTGVLTFKSVPDYGTPTDSGEDNIYKLDITANRGQPFNDSQILPFTVAVNDILPPSIKSSIPANGLENFTGTEIILNFSEKIKTGRGRIEIINTENDQVLDGMGVSSNRVIIEGKKVTLSLNRSLPLEEKFYLKIPQGAFKDLNDKEFAGLLNKEDLSFETPTIPKLLSSTPESNGTEFNAEEITLTFDRNLIADRGRISILSSSTDQEVFGMGVNSTAVTISGNTVTLNLPRKLPENGEYYINIPAVAFKDSQGLYFPGILDKAELTFQSVVSPILVSSIPANNANDFDGKTITLTFNKNVEAYRGRISIMDASTDTEVTGMGARSGRISIEDNVVTLDMIRSLPLDGTYYVLIPGVTFKGENGIFFSGIIDNSILSFSTPLSPQLVESMPSDNTIDFSGSEISLTFDREMFAGRGRISIHNSSNNQVEFSIGVSSPRLNIEGNTASFDLPYQLPSGNYYVRIPKSAFLDSEGLNFLGLLNSDELNFTVQSNAIASNAFKTDESELEKYSSTLLSVYPNPSHDAASIVVNLPSKAQGKLTLINSKGEILKSLFDGESSTKLELNTSVLPEGVYLLKLQSTVGIAYQKLLIQH